MVAAGLICEASAHAQIPVLIISLALYNPVNDKITIFYFYTSWHCWKCFLIFTLYTRYIARGFVLTLHTKHMARFCLYIAHQVHGQSFVSALHTRYMASVLSWHCTPGTWPAFSPYIVHQVHSQGLSLSIIFFFQGLFLIQIWMPYHIWKLKLYSAVVFISSNQICKKSSVYNRFMVFSQGICSLVT